MNYNVIKLAGFTQQEFADLVGFSRPTVNLWINGKKEPGPHTARIVAFALDELHKAVVAKRLPSYSAERDTLKTEIAKAVDSFAASVQ